MICAGYIEQCSRLTGYQTVGLTNYRVNELSYYHGWKVDERAIKLRAYEANGLSDYW